MNLKPTPEQASFRAEVRDWLEHNLAKDVAAKVLSNAQLSGDEIRNWARTLGRKGWLASGWPREHGGPGWSPIEKHIFEEECALAGAPPVMPFGPVMVAPVIMTYGTDEQKRRFLPGIASGEVWWSQGYSEPGAGSDLASLKTRAERAGDHYVVNGQKTWTTMAQHGDWIFCLVRTSQEGRPQAGISFLLVDMRSPGVTVRPIRLLNGEHDVNEVWFENVRVPLENLVGEENRGWTYAKLLLSHERTSIAEVGLAKRRFRSLLGLARDEGALDDRAFCHQVAVLQADIIALEVLVLRSLSASGKKHNALDVAGLLKLRGSEVQQRCTELMMLAAGPNSLPRTLPSGAPGLREPQPSESVVRESLASTYFHCRATSIYGGSNEVQRNILAQALMG